MRTRRWTRPTISASTSSTPPTSMAGRKAKERHFPGLVSEQSKYSLVTRNVEQEVLPACQHYGLGVIPWSPLEGGILGGALEKQEKARRSGEQAQQRVAKLRPQLEKWESF